MAADTEARISAFAELIGTVVVAGYRDEQKRQVLDDMSRRSSLIDALLAGRVGDDSSVAEVAGHLGLRKNGPFVVIAAKVRVDDVEPLTAIESKLQSVDVHSAWQFLPVSARFDDLRETPQALHFAKMTQLGRPSSDSPVAVFDGTLLATAALAAPEVMIKSAGATLACFGDLPDEEREVLFETFRVWQDTDASLGACAERLCCAPEYSALPIATNRETDRAISFAPKGCRRTMFGVRSSVPAHRLELTAPLATLESAMQSGKRSGWSL
jgi:hypothetical protein